MSPAALITGFGAVSPFGVGEQAFWRGLLAGGSALAPIRAFAAPGSKAGEVPDFDPERELGAERAARLQRVDQYALTAAREALAAAGLDLERVDRSRVGVIVGTTLGAMAVGERYLRARHGSPPQGESAGDGAMQRARQLLHLPYYAVANRLARELEVRGPVVSPSIACASGTWAVGLALDLIRRGQGDVFLAGGAEALCDFVVSGFNCLRATTGGTVRPFDARRDGLQLGEGAALLVIESAAHARARGLVPRLEVAGSGLSGDASHMTAPARDGAGAARAMRAALADAGAAPGDVDFVSAHGTGTVYNDAMEVAALVAVFGESIPRLPVSAIKGAIGHTLGAAGAFEAVLCARALREGVLPPSAGCEELEEGCPLDLVRAPRRGDFRLALSTSSAFAGNNAAVVVRRLD